MFPNSDPVMFMVAFYGCLLAELVPVPIEVPLTRKVAAGSRPWAQVPEGHSEADSLVVFFLLCSKEQSADRWLMTKERRTGRKGLERDVK